MLSRLLTVLLFVASLRSGLGQDVPSTPLQQVQASANAAVTAQSLELTGTAVWTAGALTEHGTASLKASRDGSSTLQLNLNTATRTETLTTFDSKRTCQWIDSLGKTYNFADLSCMTATPWFAPSLLAAINAQFPTLMTVTDDGQVTKNGTLVHQLSYVFNLVGRDAATTKRLTEASRFKMYFDLVTLLPAAFEYNIHPDADDAKSIPVSVVYSDYRSVSGASLPFHIERSVNRTLQLTLVLNTVLIN